MFTKLMKTACLFALVAFLFTSCSKDEQVAVQPAKTEAMKAFEIESYNIVKRNGALITFTTQAEVLDHLAGTDRYEVIKEKFDLMNAERKKILELGLIEMNEDDPAVIEYLAQFETAQVRVGPLNFCHHGTAQAGPTVWTPTLNPSIKRKNRNRYSSITAISPQTLCTRKWWGGRQYFFWGTHDSLPSGCDNNSESYL